MKSLERFTEFTSRWVGTSGAFMAAVASVVVWLALGPVFRVAALARAIHKARNMKHLRRAVMVQIALHQHRHFLQVGLKRDEILRPTLRLELAGDRVQAQ